MSSGSSLLDSVVSEQTVSRPRGRYRSRYRSRVLIQRFVQVGLGACTLLAVSILLGILWVLLLESIQFFRTVPFTRLVSDTSWAPMLEPREYNVLPLLNGTLLVVLGSSLLALPLGLMGAIYLSQYCSGRGRTILKASLEMLAGVPSVVYGYIAIATITPTLQRFIPDLQVFNSLSAALMLGVMILPTTLSLCDDALTRLPRAMSESGYAVGATRWEVIRSILIPGAGGSILLAFGLSVTRAIGETMVVAMAAGATPVFTLDPRVSIQTITGFMAQISMGDISVGSLEYQTLFVTGGILLCLNLGFMTLLRRIARNME